MIRTLRTTKGLLWSLWNVSIRTHLQKVQKDPLETIFFQLKQVDELTIENYEAMMIAYSKNELPDSTIVLLKDFHQSGLEMSSIFYSTFLSNLIRKSVIGKNEAEESYRLLKLFYNPNYASYINNTRLFFEICTLYCKFEDDQAVNVLVDMIRAKHEPLPELCSELLNAALFYKDFRILRILMSWYSNDVSFGSIRISYGQLFRLLEISSQVGDVQLATIAVQLLEKNAYPLLGHHFYSLINSFKASNEFTNAVEAVVEMEKKCIPFSIFPATNLSCLLTVRKFLVDMLVNDANRSKSVETFYSALVDHLEDGEPVPELLLQVLLVALGKSGDRDRTINTFHRFESQFHIKLSAGYYNALLAGCLDSPTTILEIFQELCEKASEGKDGLEGPDEESYTMLCEAVIDSPKYQEVIKNMLSNTENIPKYSLDFHVVRKLILRDGPLSSVMVEALESRSRSRVDSEFIQTLQKIKSDGNQ